MADGEVIVEVRAETGKFDNSLKRARSEAGKFDSSQKRAGAGVDRLTKKTTQGATQLNRYQKSLKSAADSAALVTGPLGGVASRISILGRVSSVSGLAILGVSAAIGALTLGLAAAISEADKFERSQHRVESVLKATGNSAGFTAKEIRQMSREIALSTLASVEGVERAATKLLTFRDVQGETFREALELSQDLAEIGFGSIESAATGLGKALQDPITGLTLLAKQGTLTKAQQREIGDEFERTGNLAKAQADILKALGDQVRDAGKVGGLSAALDTLDQRVSEFGQSVATNTGALELWTDMINFTAAAFEQLNEVLFDTPEERLNGLIAQRIQLQGQLNEITSRSIPLFRILEGSTRERIANLDKTIAAMKEAAAAETKAQADARASAKAAAAKAAAERKAAVAAKAAKEERERIEKLRKTTIRGLNDEISALTGLSQQYTAGEISLRDFANAQDKANILASLNLDITSAQGKAVSDLIDKRNALNKTIEQETAKRQDAQKASDRLAAVNTEIRATEMLTAAIGGTDAQMREAEASVAGYRLQQELLAEAIKRNGTLTEEQRDAISKTAEEYAKVVGRLGDVTAAQEKARESAERQQQMFEDFQNTLADGLTNMIFNTESFEDALKSMILQISKAIVQAEALNTIQMATGGGTGGTQGFAQTFLGGLVSGFTGGGSVTATSMHTGGTGGIDGQRISVPASNFISAPRFHEGLKPDEFPAILQKGEEVVPKDQVGGRSSGNTVNNFNITTPDADSFRMSQRQLSRKLKQTTAAT